MVTFIHLTGSLLLPAWAGGVQGCEESWDLTYWEENRCCSYPVWILVILESCVKTHRQIREKCLCNGRAHGCSSEHCFKFWLCSEQQLWHIRCFIAYQKLQRSDLCPLAPKSTMWCKCFKTPLLQLMAVSIPMCFLSCASKCSWYLSGKCGSCCCRAVHGVQAMGIR